MAHIGYGYGSEWHLLQYLGRRRTAFTQRIESLTGCSDINWLDNHEYRDPSDKSLSLREARGVEFLSSDDPIRLEWGRLWPQSGNVHNWDAIGLGKRATEPSWVLLEAKAHLGELTSSCTAKAEGSRRRFQVLLDRTRRELGVSNESDWTREYYQYANRVALLHFLRERGLDACLVFAYFTGDRADLGKAGRECPVSETEWKEALTRQTQHVGLPPNAPIRNRIHSVCLPAYRTKIAEQILKTDYCRSGAILPKAD